LLSSFFRRPRVFVLAGIALLAVIAGGVYLFRGPAAVTPALTYSEFVQQIDRGQVKQIRAAADGSLVITLANGSTASTVAPLTFLSTDAAQLARKGVQIEL